MGRRALITGITGQDGAYLAQLLLDKGYEVFGMYRRSASPNFWRLHALGLAERVNLAPGDVTDFPSLLALIERIAPDEIYNLAAMSFIGTSFEIPIATGQVDGLGVVTCLEAIRTLNPRGIRFYQASTSEIFGRVRPDHLPLREDSEKTPASPYGAAKLYGYQVTRIYREAYGLYAVNGILFNHESPLRGLEFVSRKISNAAAKIALGLDKELVLGNVHAVRDWGYAPEYVESMWLMLQAPAPDDYVICTGEGHSVLEMVEECFRHLGLDYEAYLRVDDALRRPLDVDWLVGDAGKAHRVLGWSPRVKFHSLMKIMVEADLERWRRFLEGKPEVWDAPFHLSEHRHFFARNRLQPA